MRAGNVIRVLGPIDLLTPCGVRSIGSRNARALLGALVVAAGHTVPIDRLRGAIWSTAPPRTADSSMQTYVSRLRHLLGSDAIVHEDHTYRLDVTRDQIDALRFEDLLARAAEVRDEPAACVAHCREALALWRGDPFGDLGDDEAFRLEAMRLEELRLAAMEMHLGAELALDHHELVVAELESAVREHPYREHLWYLLVQALAAGDRRVEALRACRELRHALAGAGLSPSDDLRRLEQRILDAGDVLVGDDARGGDGRDRRGRSDDLDDVEHLDDLDDVEHLDRAERRNRTGGIGGGRPAPRAVNGHHVGRPVRGREPGSRPT